jgi:hypothetical protein
MCGVKASAALGRGASNIGNAGISGKRRVLYVYKPIEGAGAAESYYSRRGTHSAERSDRISQANAAVRGVDVDSNADDINNDDVAPEPRSDVVAADEIAGRRSADVPRGYDAGQRAVSSETDAGEERGGRRRRGAAENAKIYKTMKRRHRRREGDDIHEHSK